MDGAVAGAPSHLRNAARGGLRIEVVETNQPDRKRIIQWAVALAVFALLVYGTFIYLVGTR